MKHNLIIITISILCLLENMWFLYAANTTREQVVSSTIATPTASTSTQIWATTGKEKIKVIDSELCKKYFCNLKSFEINCSNKSMTSIFSPDEWQTLLNGDVCLDTIIMSHNKITQIPTLPTYPVKSLYLSFNKINNISIGAFQNLSQLEFLDLSNNKLTSTSLNPDVFKGKYAPENYEPLKNLKTLDLSHNELHTLKSDVFEHLPNLENLSLSKNLFQVIDIPATIAIASLNSLRILDLSFMELAELPDTILNSPPKLETLILTGNLFRTIPSALTRAKHLKKLVLDENPLVDINNENIFRSLGELQFLSISYLPDITNIGPSAFTDLQNLTTLIAIYNPRLASIHKLAFTKNTSNPDIFEYPPLKKLLLHNNNLTTIEQNWIVRWDKINAIDLRFNPWVCDCTNSWFIHSLMKQINNTAATQTKDILCELPLSWKEKPLIELTDNESELICTNTSHSEYDNLILIGVLIGVLIGIPLTFGGLVIYRKGCFGFINWQNRSYNRASFADELQI